MATRSLKLLTSLQLRVFGLWETKQRDSPSTSAQQANFTAWVFNKFNWEVRKHRPYHCHIAWPQRKSDLDHRMKLQRAKRTITSLDSLTFFASLTNSDTHMQFIIRLIKLVPLQVSVFRTVLEYNHPPIVSSQLHWPVALHFLCTKRAAGLFKRHLVKRNVSGSHLWNSVNLEQADPWCVPPDL